MDKIYIGKSKFFGSRHRLSGSVAVLLVLVLLTGTVFSYSSSAFAAPEPIQMHSTSDQIQEAKQEKEETEAEIAAAKDKVDALSGDVGELKGELEELNGLNEAQRAQYIEIAEELAVALLAKKEALRIYLEAQDTLEVKKLEYSERISVMFEFQNKSTLEILLESDSLAGFFTNLEIIELIADSDQQIMEEMQAALDEAQLKSDYALQESQDMQAVADEKSAELAELEALIGETEETLNRKQAELSEWEKKEKELEEESERLGNEIAELQRKLYGGGSGGTPPDGQLTWPYPGDYTIYSAFGMRFHPIYHRNKMHYGVDLGGTFGNPIVSAASGTVILVRIQVKDANWGGSGYGNYLIIDHGGGMTTTYAHCKSILVSVGDTVSEGEKIATCGSTGGSTGPHLHFEVRMWGTAKDPADYIT
ncbi:MAG: peptidoglycan DD-metalloendopeptidase family protein [Clostridiales bacterium]|nr:peptidoglycan DD-metalloendopeptidase family protein [Clostridiales bacterium]